MIGRLCGPSITAAPVPGKSQKSHAHATKTGPKNPATPSTNFMPICKYAHVCRLSVSGSRDSGLPHQGPNPHCPPLLPCTQNGHRGALRGTPGSACPRPKPNPTELPVAPLSQREMHKDGGGGSGGGEARRARAARAPRPIPAPRPVEYPLQRPAPRPSRACPSRAAQGKRVGWWEMTRSTMNTFTL